MSHNAPGSPPSPSDPDDNIRRLQRRDSNLSQATTLVGSESDSDNNAEQLSRAAGHYDTPDQRDGGFQSDARVAAYVAEAGRVRNSQQHQRKRQMAAMKVRAVLASDELSTEVKQRLRASLDEADALWWDGEYARADGVHRRILQE